MIALCIVLVVLALGVGFLCGVNNGTKNAIKSKATTYDQTLKYLEPINEFIERTLYLELHRRIHDGKSDSLNGRIALVRMLSTTEETTALMSHIVAIVSLTISRNLKNAFYRLYSDNEIEKTLEMYIINYCMIRLRTIVTEAMFVMQSSAGENRESAATALYLKIEAETQQVILGRHIGSNGPVGNGK